MDVRAVAQCHPETHALPLHSAGQHAIGATDNVVRVEYNSGAHGVGATGNQRPTGAKAGDGILLDCERMQISTDDKPRSALSCREL